MRIFASEHLISCLFLDSSESDFYDANFNSILILSNFEFMNDISKDNFLFMKYIL